MCYVQCAHSYGYGSSTRNHWTHILLERIVKCLNFIQSSIHWQKNKNNKGKNWRNMLNYSNEAKTRKKYILKKILKWNVLSFKFIEFHVYIYTYTPYNIFSSFHSILVYQCTEQHKHNRLEFLFSQINWCISQSME